MRGLPIFCAVAVLLLVSSGARCEPAKIRISWVAVPNNLPPLFMSKPEMMKHAGTSYTVDPIRFPGTPQSVAALASGDLDIALLTFSSFPLAIQNAGLQDLRVISDEFIDGFPGDHSAEFMVLKDGPVKAIKDLKGRVVAVNVRVAAPTWPCGRSRVRRVFRRSATTPNWRLLSRDEGRPAGPEGRPHWTRRTRDVGGFHAPRRGVHAVHASRFAVPPPGHLGRARGLP